MTVYTDTGQALTLSRLPTTGQQNSQPCGIPTASDLLNLAAPGERITFTMSIDRQNSQTAGTTGTPNQPRASTGMDEYGNDVYPILTPPIFKVLVMICGGLALLKLAETVAEHPVQTIAVGGIAVCCAGAYWLARGGQRQ